MRARLKRRKRRRARGRRVSPIKRYQEFWGVAPTKITRVGKSRKQFIGLGRSPAITLADGPKGRSKRHRRLKLSSAMLLTNNGGNRFWIWRKKSEFGKPVRMLGYAAAVEYVPSAKMERQGTPKARKHWIHKVGEEGGNWPKVFQDRSGNLILGACRMRAFGGRATSVDGSARKVKWLRD